MIESVSGQVNSVIKAAAQRVATARAHANPFLFIAICAIYYVDNLDDVLAEHSRFNIAVGKQLLPYIVNRL